MITINAIKCLMCGDTIFSRSRHDFRSCYCGNVSVDGGPFYHDDSGMIGGERYERTSVYITNMAEIDDLHIDLESINLFNIEKILLEDWSLSKDKYGLTRDYMYTDEKRISAKAKIELLR